MTVAVRGLKFTSFSRRRETLGYNSTLDLRLVILFPEFQMPLYNSVGLFKVQFVNLLKPSNEKTKRRSLETRHVLPFHRVVINRDDVKFRPSEFDFMFVDETFRYCGTETKRRRVLARTVGGWEWFVVEERFRIDVPRNNVK